MQRLCSTKGIMYNWIHKRLIDNIGVNCYCNKDDFFIMMSKLYHVPKPYVILIVREMEEENMIRLDKKDIQVLPSKIDLDAKRNQIAHQMGVF